MSDMSHCWCKTCRQPEYACECDDEDQNLEERPRRVRWNEWDENTLYTPAALEPKR